MLCCRCITEKTSIREPRGTIISSATSPSFWAHQKSDTFQLKLEGSFVWQGVLLALIRSFNEWSFYPSFVKLKMKRCKQPLNVKSSESPEDSKKKGGGVERISLGRNIKTTLCESIFVAKSLKAATPRGMDPEGKSGVISCTDISSRLFKSGLLKEDLTFMSSSSQKRSVGLESGKWRSEWTFGMVCGHRASHTASSSAPSCPDHRDNNSPSVGSDLHPRRMLKGLLFWRRDFYFVEVLPCLVSLA